MIVLYVYVQRYKRKRRGVDSILLLRAVIDFDVDNGHFGIVGEATSPSIRPPVPTDTRPPKSVQSISTNQSSVEPSAEIPPPQGPTKLVEFVIASDQYPEF
jgi:hypothetical protein